MSELGDLGYHASAYELAQENLHDVRGEVIVAILAALRAGYSPTKVAKASPFSASYVRKLARVNGIPAP